MLAANEGYVTVLHPRKSGGCEGALPAGSILSSLVECRVRAACFPVAKSLDIFDYMVIPSLIKHMVTQRVRHD